MLLDFVKLLFVYVLFALPFYALGLFWGVEYGEYFGLASAALVVLLVALSSGTFFRQFFNASKPLKNRRIINSFHNTAYLKGLARPRLYKMDKSGQGIKFFKTLFGQSVILVNPESLEKLKQSELNALADFYLSSLESVSILRGLGPVIIYIMGIPLNYVSRIKSLSLFGHFFFIPFKFLNSFLYSTSLIRQRITANKDADELRTLNGALTKLFKTEKSVTNIFEVQVYEVCSIMNPRGETLYDLIIEKNNQPLGSFG